MPTAHLNWSPSCHGLSPQAASDCVIIRSRTSRVPIRLRLKCECFARPIMMINLFLPWSTPRDETKLSPHAHTDFEQISLALESTFAHHLRYPWTPDKTTWRDDAHLLFGSPSALVIPARVIHTSHNIGNGVARLVDIFAPPRLDFSRTDGFVLNAGEYPPPS